MIDGYRYKSLFSFYFLNNKYHIQPNKSSHSYKHKLSSLGPPPPPPPPPPRRWESLSVRPFVHLSIPCCGHSNLVIFYWITSKFHIWIDSIKLLFKFEYKFSLTNDNQDGRHLSGCFCGQSSLIIYYPIASKFHILITFIKLSLRF